jgi:exoribonuclease R
MLQGKVGILRTMPAPDEASLRHFHRQTHALGKPWDGEMRYGEYLRTLDPTDPRQLAIVHSAGMLFRGAGYTPFDGTVPDAAVQSAIGAAYAHSTAPLRRLVDRFVLVICEALSNGTEVPAWAREALPSLPAIMGTSDQLAAKLERLSLDTVEAALLVNHIGQEFDAVVISGPKPAKSINGTSNGNGGKTNGNGNGPSGIVQIAEPAVTARCPGELEPGTKVRVRVVSSDIATREIQLELVG